MSKFYAVAAGKEPGIYDTWQACKLMVTGFPNAKYKGFEKLEDALEYLEQPTDDYSNKTESDFETYAFVDGSYNEKTNTYGYGGFIIHKEVKEDEKTGRKTWLMNKNIIKGSGNNEDYIGMRNITGEILGCMEAIKKAIELNYKELAIFYDYAGIEMWATGAWNRNKKLTKSYYEFFQSIKKKIDIKFVKVKGHTQIEGNEEADRLAKEACGIIEVKEDKNETNEIFNQVFDSIFGDSFNSEENEEES